MTPPADPAAPWADVPALRARLAALKGLDEGRALAGEIRALAARLVALDLPGVLVCQTLSGLNDQLTQALIALIARRHRLPPVAWCWLALGSEGRHEQTLFTDQDNGLIFSAADAREAEALRALFLPFAEAVNAALADCGFSRCPGGIMAGNPEWCLSAQEWRECFLRWVRVPEPDALLNAAIFFDLRALHGDAALVDALQAELLGYTREAAAFLHLMAVNAMQAEPPLGFRGALVLGDAEAPEDLDLKKYGSRIFVDVARIFALAHGLPAVDTVTRLTLAGQAARLSADEIRALLAAFSHLLRLRLQRQVDPSAHWHPLDRSILRDVLQQARRLQQRLKLNYGL